MALVTKNFSDIITFTRASTATYFNSAGVLTSAATNAPRFDYNPSTLAAQGLLIEEARTNSIRNNTMVGAVAGTPGTLPTNWSGAAPAVNVIGTGTENGITYVDLQIVGTTGATTGNIAFDTVTATAAASGQTWTNSVYIRQVGGSLTNITQIRVNMQGYTSASASNADSLSSTDIASSLSATSIATNRRTLTATLADATTAYVRPRLFINWTNGAAIDITLRIGLPQLEQGAFATSVIPTTTTALTRAADVASVNTLSPWFNATEGTLFADWTSYIPNGTTGGLTYATGFTNNVLSSGSAQLVIQNRALNNQIRVWQSTAGGGLDDSIQPSFTAYFGKSAAAYGGGSNVAASANGGAVVTMTNPIQTTSFNALLLGYASGATGYLGGWIRRITYYPRRLSNAELQAITA